MCRSPPQILHFNHCDQWLRRRTAATWAQHAVTRTGTALCSFTQTTCVRGREGNGCRRDARLSTKIPSHPDYLSSGRSTLYILQKMPGCQQTLDARYSLRLFCQGHEWTNSVTWYLGTLGKSWFMTHALSLLFSSPPLCRFVIQLHLCKANSHDCQQFTLNSSIHIQSDSVIG